MILLERVTATQKLKTQQSDKKEEGAARHEATHLVWLFVGSYAASRMLFV